MANEPMPARYKLELMRGDVRVISVMFADDGEPRDLTGYAFAAQIRAVPDDADVMTSFACTVPDPAAGVVLLTLTKTAAEALVPGTARWDFQSTLSGEPHTWLAGPVEIVADVTR